MVKSLYNARFRSIGMDPVISKLCYKGTFKEHIGSVVEC